MTESESDSQRFETLSRELLNKGLTVRFQARGASMSPCIRDGEIVHVTAVIVSKLRKGDIVLTKGHSGFRVHRLVLIDQDKNLFMTRGDCGRQDDPPVHADQILGIVLAKEVRLGTKIVTANLNGFTGKLLQGAVRAQYLAGKLLRIATSRSSNIALALLLLLSLVSYSRAQVVIDATTSTSSSLNARGAQAVTFTHTTAASTTGLLIVGVAMDTVNATTTTVSSVTYNATGLTFLGAQDDAAKSRRVEMWYLLSPAAGTNNVVVTVNIPGAVNERVGVVAGAVTFTGVNQAVPVGPFVSASGAAGTASSDTVPSVLNGMVMDTLAVAENVTVTVPGTQTSLWNVRSGAVLAGDVRSTGSTAPGSPSVTMTETFSAASNWAQGAVSINPAAQVIVDAATSIEQAINASGIQTVTFAHTTATTTTGLLIVGVAMNIVNAPTTTVSSVTYNGTALHFLGAHNDAGNTRRVEMWYLLSPAAGTFNIVVSVDIPGGTAEQLGVVAGAVTFTGVDQTVPLSPFVSANGANGANSQLDVPSVINGMILDTLSVAGNQAVTVPGPQVSEWNTNTGAGATDVRSSGSARTGAPSVPISETFSGTSNWSLGAVSINPSTADIAVTTSVGSAVFLGQNTTYNITVSNNGYSAANSVTLTDTLASGMTLVSVTPSAGTTCTGSGPITCTLPTPFASGATATIAVVETASATGSFANTATITDSGSPPDPNTGNNSYTAVATVQSISCASVSQATTGTNLSGILNTYYPGTTSVAAGATSIPVGAATGAGSAIAAGNLLLIIQMQDASINDANTIAYGNGSSGQGFTNLNSAGDYEFVTAQNAVPATGGSVTITGAGTGGGTVFAYHSAAVSANAGQSKYQVIVVPQYSTASFNATTPPTALAWNGSTGGVLALDTSGTLTLSGATIAVDGLGFRGGAGMQLTGGAGAATDYEAPAPATYTGAAGGEAGYDANKGEGIAGTPAWVESGTTFLQTNTGYPSGTAGTDGSMARGAPGNAGAGGTDSDPVNNDQNAGGGGGANGGAGGFGGDSWNTNLSVGGEGGTVFPATINRVAMGGGGGAGTRNNSDGDNRASGGATGGGIIIIRTYGLSGTGTLTANGISAYNGTLNDAGGGGGAGGSIVVLSANGGESGLTLQANGGNGGNAWEIEPYTLGNRHGPGGGGGGGVVLISGTPASISLSGGASGLTENPGVPYGSTAGAAGTSVTNASITQTSGTQSGAQCTPDMTLGKSHVGNFTRGSTASYTIPVENLSPYGPTNGTVTVNDTMPVGLTPTSATGTGWSCSIASQTVSCVTSAVLPANSFYPSLTINANVLQTAPSVETNTALVSGGGEVNLANDSATDVANVISTADLSITNAASPDPVVAGGNITYTQVVTNNGPSAADNATMVEAVPNNTTFVSMAAPAGWSCTTPAVGSTGNVVCTNLNMAGSTAATFALVVKVNTGTANGTVITDTAKVSSSVSDPNSANNTASASTIVGSSAGADLVVTNAASPNGVAPGGNITYTQVVTNVGSLTATAATFTESTSPVADVTFVSVSAAAAPGWTCTAPPVSCTNPSVAAGATGTITAIYKVNAATPIGTLITNTATVNAANQTSGPNTAIASDTVTATTSQSDLGLTTAATPLSVFAGNDITYLQTITNSGPAAATSVSFLEAVPTNTTFASVSAPAGWTCTTPAVGATGNITCTDPTLAATTSASIIVVVNVPSSVTAAAIAATSSVSATNALTITTNTSTPVTTACDLAVSNSGTPSPVAAGGTITYTQVVTNTGPSNCANLTFNEAIPTNTTFTSYGGAPAGWTCTSFATGCTNPSFAPGSISTFTVVVTVNAGTAAGTIITDTDTVTTTTRDTNTSNNSATVNIPVASATQADLSVSNSASPNPVSAGNNITYAQTVVNTGPASASTISLAESLPANTTAVSLTGPAGWTCSVGTLTCTISTLAVTTANFTFVVKVNSNATPGSTITQTDTVTSANDPNPGNNSASASVLVAGSADLSVTNTASPVPVVANNNITYTQVVTNAGPSIATAASFTETTPANTTFFSIGTLPAGWSCSTPAVGSAGTINCTNPSFAPGSASFTVALKVTAGTAAGTAINDIAAVSSSTSDPNSANNTAIATDVVALATQADLIVTNSATPTSVAAGSNITYTQSVTNNGPAAATTVSFTQSTPPNTTFQSITTPAGWTCTTPAVGATGTITCTIATLALNASASFTLVLQVNAATASGTNIAEAATATASNIVPGLTSNTAVATVVVANPNSASLAIVKTAMPSPTVAEGDTLTYTIGITNNGPSSATNVTVTDPLPADVTYLSLTTSAGTCSEAGGTVTCLLGTIANGGTATITILTLAGAPGIATNTASVVAGQMTTPNTSTQVETITAATSIKLESFVAQTGQDKTGAHRVVLLWKTGTEVHNLGFNIYREQAGERVRLNSSLIAGSALLMNGALPKHSGRTYSWIDSSANAGSAPYWLEDVDVNGTRILHGPVSATASSNSQVASNANATPSVMLNHLNQSQPAASVDGFSHRVEDTSPNSSPTATQQQKQFALAAHSAIKIYVKHEGWYCVTQPQLIAAGLSPNVDPAYLHLYAEAVEQPIAITGTTAGVRGFGPQAAIYFYGTGIDTQYSGTRVYFLVTQDSKGARVHNLPVSTGSNQPPASFPFTVELAPHTTYYSALTTANGYNFFGPLVSSTAVDETIQVPHLDSTSTESAKLDVILQGVILGVPHDVTVTLNGTSLGDVTFTGEAKGTLDVTLPLGVLQEGANTVTLTSQNGEYDYSLLQSIRITYPHTYAADSNELTFTARPGEELSLTGFTQSSVAVVDITDPNQPVQLTPQVTTDPKSETYTAAIQVPWSTTNPSTPAQHTLMAVVGTTVASPAGIRQNHPSRWYSAQSGSEIVMVTSDEFSGALAPLKRAHEALGKSSALVLVDDLYDEFTFGQHNPLAIRSFLQTAVTAWHTTPHYLLLNGRASFDPRNYLGFGHLDFVPTQIIATSGLMTASDGWFSDFNDTGIPTIATGRLPVSTPAEAQLVAGKIAIYEGQSTDGPWTSQALVVADTNDTENFTKDSQLAQAQLPSSVQVTDVFLTTTSVPDAQQTILNSINSGELLVNYSGHGSEDEWSGENLFNSTEASTLTNGSSLPVFLIMDCLNGFFQDVYEEPLAVSLMLAPDGGAVAVLASSGLNQAPPQTTLDKLVVQSAMGPSRLPLGDAIIKAKSGITDLAVRKTYNLLGDPVMQIKPPVATKKH
ncbi:MAG: C25 family cysteine peptidase [Candidatus Sulfotelmatobacter sp.]